MVQLYITPLTFGNISHAYEVLITNLTKAHNFQGKYLTVVTWLWYPHFSAGNKNPPG